MACWGCNAQGQTDRPDTLADVNLITGGGAHSCAGRKAVFDNLLPHQPDNVLCWGADHYGQARVPLDLQAGAGLVALSAGVVDSCVLNYKVGLVCWGFMQQYYAHMSTASWHLEAVAVHEQELRPYMVSVGWNVRCVLGLKGNIECVGDDEYGQCMLNNVSGDDSFIG